MTSLRPLLLLLTLGAPALQAQSGWAVRSAPAVEFWYHALAVVGFQGFGALPLYDPGYPTTLRADRDARGVAPTALEREATVFRQAFEQDSVFEALHFVPLYASTAGAAQLLETHAPGLLSGMLDPTQRALLDRFLRAARNELDAAWTAERRAAASDLNARLQRITDEWESAVGPAIAGYLAREGLSSGILLPVPGLGPDGRFLPATRDAPPVVAVQLPRDPARAPDAAYFAVRELCYPAVRRALAGQPAGDRVAAEALSGRAAVQCGALLLDRADPALGGRYRDAFLRALGRPQDPGAFEASFAIQDALRERLAAALERAP